jgi:vacuolar-type H+-ATPase subunit H
MSDPEKDLAALKEATRAAHEATKDLIAATKEARKVIEEIKAEADEQVDQRLSVALKEGLDELAESVGQAIETATTAVYDRFDRVADILLGETKSDIRSGSPSLPSLAKKVAEKNNNG